MIFKLQNSKKILKAIIYAALLILFYVLQTNPFLFWDLASPNLLLTLSVCIAMFEGEITSGIVGLFAGFLKDISSSSVFGFHGLFYMLTAICISLTVMYLLRQTMLNALAILGVCYVFLSLLYAFFYFLIFQKDGAAVYFLNILPVSFVLTIVIFPAVFLLIRKLNKLL